ncbi:MAG: hypothetical protein U5M51_09220 [Emticicia sp.]|nr:hypothetical protein [Emticicia sp.]
MLEAIMMNGAIMKFHHLQVTSSLWNGGGSAAVVVADTGHPSSLDTGVQNDSDVDEPVTKLTAKASTIIMEAWENLHILLLLNHSFLKRNISMFDTNDFKKGLKIELESKPYVVLTSTFTNPGKGSAFVVARIKNLEIAK